MDTKPNYPDADRPCVFDEGIAFQEFAAKVLRSELYISLDFYETKKEQFQIGESKQGFEIKLDNRILETGNVSIEVAEKSHAGIAYWTPSGIMREDNTWIYVQGNESILFIFGKVILRLIYNHSYRDKVWQPKPTLQTFLLPVKEAERIALKVFRFQSQQFDRNSVPVNDKAELEASLLEWEAKHGK